MGIREFISNALSAGYKGTDLENVPPATNDYDRVYRRDDENVYRVEHGLAFSKPKSTKTEDPYTRNLGGRKTKVVKSKVK